MATGPEPDQAEELAKLRQQVARLDRRAQAQSQGMVRLQANAVGMSAGVMGLLVSLALPWKEVWDGPATGWTLMWETLQGYESAGLLGAYLGLVLTFSFALRAYLSEEAGPYRVAQVSAYLFPLLVLGLWPWADGIGSGVGVAVFASLVIGLTTGRARATVT